MNIDITKSIATEKLQFIRARIERAAKRNPKRKFDSLLKRLDARIVAATTEVAPPSPPVKVK